MISDKEVKNYFDDNYPELKLLFFNNKKIVVEDNDSNKLAIPFGNKSIEDFLEGRGYGDTIDQEEMIRINAKLNIFTDVGYQYKNTLEVILRYSVTDYENCSGSNTMHCNVFDLWNFCIGNNEVAVGHPSDMFKLIFKNYEEDDFFTGWDGYNTIRIIGDNSIELQNVLQQAIFWIYQMCPSVYDISFPEVGQLCYEDGKADIGVDELPPAKDIFIDEYNNDLYKLSNYVEPIYFYNAAKRINDIDIAFLYFYKILEFFFIISQKEKIKQNVNDLLISNDFEGFIDTMHTDYFGKKEDLLLDQLINIIDNKVISEVQDLAFNNKIIISNNNDKEFGSQLYLHRNSIVHGKFDFKNLKLKLPNKINDEKSRIWTEIIEKISFYLIKTYCYDKL